MINLIWWYNNLYYKSGIGFNKGFQLMFKMMQEILVYIGQHIRSNQILLFYSCELTVSYLISFGCNID